MQITETLTSRQINRKTAVDYVLSTLVYVDIRLLRQIVSNEVSRAAATISGYEGVDTEIDVDESEAVSLEDHKRPSHVVYTGQITGVLVWSCARLLHQLKRRKKQRMHSNDLENIKSCLREQCEHGLDEYTDKNKLQRRKLWR